MKTFNNVINSIICCAMEARTSIVLNIEIVQFVLQNYEKLLSEVCMIKKHLIVIYTIIHYIYKRLVYTSPDLLAIFCKVNLSNTKKSAYFLFYGL